MKSGQVSGLHQSEHVISKSTRTSMCKTRTEIKIIERENSLNFFDSFGIN